MTDRTLPSERDTDPPGEGFSALVTELRAALERSNELTVRLLNRIALVELSELAGETKLQTHDLEIADVKRRLDTLEAKAAE